MNRALRYGFEATLGALAGGLASLCPRGLALTLGRALGRLWVRLDRRHFAIARENLRRSFPSWDLERCESVARGVYTHFGAVVVDLLWMQERSGAQLVGLVEFVGEEHVRSALAGGRGVLYATAHLGNWEIHAIAHALRHGPLSVVARPLDNPKLDARLCALRSMTGNAVIYKRRALARVLRELREGRQVAMLLDQNMLPSDGIFVEFFGRPAAATTVGAALALKTGCALVPAWTELLPSGRYRLHYEPALEVRPDAPHAEEIARLTQLLARTIESWIRQVPEQWLWMHRRWKTQPEAPQS